QNETQQKKNIALLFDMIRMSRELESSLAKLKDMQSSNGGFVWFKGGLDDRYMTQYIITGIGHLKKLGALSKAHEEKIKSILNTAIPYLDIRLKEDYDNLMKYKNLRKSPYGGDLGGLSVHYMYMRSFFPEYPIAKETQVAYNYYREQSKKYWLSQSKYMQAMIALSLNRTNDNITPKAITRSLKENAINNEELGMYWKEWDMHSWWWYQAPIESQAMMIEAFSEVDKDNKTVDDLKTWLLKNKQTNNWQTTKATAEACYALLLRGTDPIAIGWLSEEKNVILKLGNTTINSKDEKQEAGTGYFKHKIPGENVKPEMGNISVTLTSTKDISNVSPKGGDLAGAAWGSVYWQYFENLDKITFAETPLKLSKKLFIEKNSDRGPVLTPINDGTQLKVGDKIKVRIELRVDRDMEYVHMKDMRAACMEPTNVISQYKYQGGLGYYESTKDASTNFFFNYLNKGTYVFEYPMFVTHSGNFSNGITTIQCMYAPEFTAHSEGVRVNVAD
ncbi:MAG: alpha-2-macroglobulin, partial [Ginsengibacter sp.]